LVTLKVCSLDDDKTQEVDISRHIQSIHADHPGKNHLRVALDEFHIDGAHGSHQCLIFATLGLNLTNLRDLFANRALDKTTLQKVLLVIATALDFLHQAGAVHTGLFSPPL
jgi:hypothetical protein